MMMLKKSFSMFNFYSRRFLSTKESRKFDRTEQSKILMEPFEYIHRVPCKHSIMIGPAMNNWLQIPENKLECIQNVNRAWDTWIILLDDIEDNSTTRYGVPAAHCVFGVGFTINAANKALLYTQKLVADLGNPLAPEIFVKRLEEFIDGTGTDLYLRDKCIFPTEEEHIEISRLKTGVLFSFPVDFMQLFSSNKTDYTELALDIGVYYELLDDYYNLFNQKSLERFALLKPENHVISSDITDGKITLAMIHAAQFPDVATELADILKQRTSDSKLQNRFISLLKKHGSDDYVKDKMIKLEADIRTQIEQFGGNPILSSFMDDLSFQSHDDKQT